MTDLLKQAREALSDLHLNVSEAMRTGGWVPTPLHQSFWQSMIEAAAAIAAIDAQQAATVGAPSVDPVAWMTKRKKDGSKTLGFGEATTNRAYAKMHKDWDWIPLYAAPPAVQALTDDRLSSAGLDYALGDALGSGGSEWTAQDIADAFKAGARAAERFHKIGAAAQGGE